jgi:integrase
MPRRAKGARLYLDRRRGQWIIRDGPHFIRTGCPAAKHEYAEKLLARYIASKYRPPSSSEPLVADILLAYAQEHAPHKRSAANIGYTIGNLERWWGDKRLTDINAGNCRAYARTKTPAAARRDLETLRAAIRFWHKHKTPLAVVPDVVLPAKAAPRERWLTREEARRLRRAAMPWPHLYRFIVIGLMTGSRSGAIRSLQWNWIDFEAGLMLRRAPGEAEDALKRTPPVRMARRLTRLLRLWKRRDGNLCRYVVHYNGKPVARFEKTWAMACERAGLDGVTPHTLRHTRATWLMLDGVDLWEAAGHLGMTPQMLQSVYGKHSADYQKRASEI